MDQAKKIKRITKAFKCQLHDTKVQTWPQKGNKQ